MAQFGDEEEWQLTQQTFDAFRESSSLCAPAATPLILGYEAREQHEEAWQLTQQTSDACHKHKFAFRKLGGMGLLTRLLRAYQPSRRSTKDSALLSIISRQERLELLASDKLSTSCRSMVSSSLRDDPNVVSVRLQIGDDELQVHQDVLCFWSKYFEAALSNRWRVLEYIGSCVTDGSRGASAYRIGYFFVCNDLLTF